MVQLVAKHIAAVEEEDIDRPGPLTHPGFACLVLAMAMDCGGTEDCSTCTLGGIGVCPFERLRGSGPAAAHSDGTSASRSSQSQSVGRRSA